MPPAGRVGMFGDRKYYTEKVRPAFLQPNRSNEVN
jgi:hypothetical protein